MKSHRDGYFKLFDLTGKVAFVTGGARGIGWALAKGLAQFGCHIVVVDIDPKDQKKVVREIEKDDQSWDVDFSKDGSYFAVKVVTIKRKMDGARRVREYAAHLIVFGSRGNELWRKENIARGEASFASRVKISDDDIITVMTGVGEYKIYSFDKNGELVREQKGNLELLRRFKQR